MKQRLHTVILLTCCVVLGTIGFFLYIGEDRKAPQITVEEMNITYQEGDHYDALFKGITARDNRDGDLSDNVFIDRIIPVGEGKAIVRYGVMDADKNIGTATRVVRYISDIPANKDNNNTDSQNADTDNGSL